MGLQQKKCVVLFFSGGCDKKNNQPSPPEEMASVPQEGFLVPPADAGAIQKAVLKLYKDPELRIRMGSAGRAPRRLWVCVGVWVEMLEGEVKGAWEKTDNYRADPHLYSSAFPKSSEARVLRQFSYESMGERYRELLDTVRAPPPAKKEGILKASEWRGFRFSLGF